MSHVKLYRSSKGVGDPSKLNVSHSLSKSQHLQGLPRVFFRFRSFLQGITLPVGLVLLDSKRGRKRSDFILRGCLLAAMIFLFCMTFCIRWLGRRISSPRLTVSNTSGLAQLLVKTKGPILNTEKFCPVQTSCSLNTRVNHCPWIVFS